MHLTHLDVRRQMRLPKICIKDGCPEVATRSGYCPSHPPARSPSSRATSAPGWKGLRQRVLDRDGWICHYCRGGASTVDHVVPAAQGGTNELSNLVAACAACNRKKG